MLWTFTPYKIPSLAVQANALCYVATKGAIEQISRVLAKDLGSRGITVNTISPGPIDTPLFRDGKSQTVIDVIVKQSPSRRLGEPEDVAPLVAFLASPAMQWINGQNIRVNGVSTYQSVNSFIVVTKLFRDSSSEEEPRRPTR